MTQQECLQTASHFTHLGVCYPGANAYIGISSPQNPQPVSFTTTNVPEPSAAALLALGIVALTLYRMRSAHA